MTLDIIKRLELFIGEPLEVVRLALNFDQIEQYNPPPNPAKMSDPRAAGYIENYGHSSWELDALEPRVIRDLIGDAMKEYTNKDEWEVTKETE